MVFGERVVLGCGLGGVERDLLRLVIESESVRSSSIVRRVILSKEAEMVGTPSSKGRLGLNCGLEAKVLARLRVSFTRDFLRVLMESSG